MQPGGLRVGRAAAVPVWQCRGCCGRRVSTGRKVRTGHHQESPCRGSTGARWLPRSHSPGRTDAEQGDAGAEPCLSWQGAALAPLHCRIGLCSRLFSPAAGNVPWRSKIPGSGAQGRSRRHAGCLAGGAPRRFGAGNGVNGQEVNERPKRATALHRQLLLWASKCTFPLPVINNVRKYKNRYFSFNDHSAHITMLFPFCCFQF